MRRKRSSFLSDEVLSLPEETGVRSRRMRVLCQRLSNKVASLERRVDVLEDEVRGPVRRRGRVSRNRVLARIRAKLRRKFPDNYEDIDEVLGE